MTSNAPRPPLVSRPVRVLFRAAVFLSALTGFAQMPIFKRYYVADIPGLGWLAQFFVTLTLHKISAMMLLALGTYVLVDYLLLQRRQVRLSVSGGIRAALIILVVITGILLAIRNMPGYRFAPEWIVVLDFSHLGLVLVFLMISLGALVLKKRWTRPAPVPDTEAGQSRSR